MADPAPVSSTPTKPAEDTSSHADTPTNVPGPALEAEIAAPHSGIQLWMHRISVFLFVLISAVAGVLLIILPWTPEWTDNYLLLTFPSLRSVVSNGFFRGICSGLGLLDIWIGFWEALHYHEQQ
jgi:hypothetical protein